MPAAPFGAVSNAVSLMPVTPESSGAADRVRCGVASMSVPVDGGVAVWSSGLHRKLGLRLGHGRRRDRGKPEGEDEAGSHVWGRSAKFG